MRNAAIIFIMLYISALVAVAQGQKPAAISAGDIRKNSIGMQLVWIPPGEFMMGSESGYADEKPVHGVTISQGFWMGKYEVTQAQWQAVMGTTLRQHRDKVNTFWDILGEGPDYPMYYVSWEQATEFVRRMNHRRDGFEHSLPSEAQWEYVTRAGTAGDYYGNLDSIAWYSGNSRNTTHPVGQKEANAFGLFDTSGNVWEWVEDIYNLNYQNLPANGSANITVGNTTDHIIRGGSFFIDRGFSRSAAREKMPPVEQEGFLGFRVAARVK